MEYKLDMPLGDRMKSYEKDNELYIDSQKHICIRIDGHKFSKYTKGFKRPFDEVLKKSMVETTKLLMAHFDSVTGYTQSDEITLVIPSRHNELRKEDYVHGFGGRVQKIASLTASFASMSFNNELKKALDEYKVNHSEDVDYIEKIEEKVGNAWFDARVFSVESQEEALNAILWRNRDASKNSISMFAYSYVSHSDVLAMDSNSRVDYVKEKTGHDWNNIDDKFKYGTTIKKEQFLLVEDVVRTRFVELPLKWEFNSFFEKLILSKYHE
jgi:tRNA(His) guanylyltransferase